MQAEWASLLPKEMRGGFPCPPFCHTIALNKLKSDPARTGLRKLAGCLSLFSDPRKIWGAAIQSAGPTSGPLGNATDCANFVGCDRFV